MPELATLLHPAVPDWSGRNRCLPSLLPPLWRDWLLDSGSLTARLSALRPGQFRVQLLAQYHGRPTPLERTELQLHGQHNVWVREVILLLGDTPLVYARTAVPITTLNGAGKRLQSLGERSLGSFLFQQPNLRRTPLRASHCKANALGLEWSRRSVFYLGDKPLMVSEAFTGALTDFL
ncbi:chorismate--pyruvate lyase family protein [Venatoribacter cucullus]|uniref:chorismate--pyruvate lyase family protein n=1 Tax=Venatoribacter cucullus TaxID=2661630 RepID=UPI00223EE06E|nr:chorismate lyase [Venatoribacter cucullus]UZK02491.1 chorismate lyase [Venatoribacter cucullus]